MVSIMEDTEMIGAMLYYGGFKNNKESKYSEVHSALKLLQHILIGLKSLQHKGHMVLKVRIQLNLQFISDN